MRGRTLNHSFVILDEAQNTTPEQMKMFLTRIGFGTKAVVTGDVTQIDLARGQKSGLIEAERDAAACAASRSRASPRPTSCAIRWCRRSSSAYERDTQRRKPTLTAMARPARSRSPSSSATRPTTLPRRRTAAALGSGGGGTPLQVTRALRRRRARAARSTRRYRGKDYATNVLTFVYDDVEPRDRRHRALRAGRAQEATAQGKPLARAHARTSSSTACCICRATTTNATPTPRAMEARETAILAALGFPIPTRRAHALGRRAKPMDDPDDKAAERPTLLERLSALLTREPEDREDLLDLLHGAFERKPARRRRAVDDRRRAAGLRDDGARHHDPARADGRACRSTTSRRNSSRSCSRPRTRASR